jgi:hypothetical protein
MRPEAARRVKVVVMIGPDPANWYETAGGSAHVLGVETHDARLPLLVIRLKLRGIRRRIAAPHRAQGAFGQTICKLGSDGGLTRLGAPISAPSGL